MIQRSLEHPLLASLRDRPVVLLHGARQVGKSTLVRSMAEHAYPAAYVTLDDATTLASARSDPSGFLETFDSAVVIDEVQRAPELFLAIKAVVDRMRPAGRFLLTGSANALMIPRLVAALVGRMEVLTLWPFSQGEIKGVKETFIDRCFGPASIRLAGSPETRDRLIRRIVTGGYPEAVATPSPARQQAWFGSHLSTLLQREIRDLAQIEGLTMLPRLLGIVAARTTGLLNYAELARSAAIPQSTLKQYLALLEATLLVQFLPAWSRNLSKRLIKVPKLMMVDSGMMASLLAVDERRLLADPTLLGRLVENFVTMELQKQATWSEARPRFYHFRDASGHEVDVVMENRRGQVVGLEVKASGTLNSHDFNGLRVLGEAAGPRFHRGVVLYVGKTALPFGSKLLGLPVSALWS